MAGPELIRSQVIAGTGSIGIQYGIIAAFIMMRQVARHGSDLEYGICGQSIMAAEKLVSFVCSQYGPPTRMTISDVREQYLRQGGWSCQDFLRSARGVMRPNGRMMRRPISGFWPGATISWGIGLRANWGCWTLRPMNTQWPWSTPG